MYNSTEVWKPKIYVATSAESVDVFKTETFDVEIHDSGLMQMNLGKMIRSTCGLDMTRFPVDSQTYSVRMLPWDYDSHRIRMFSSYSEFYMEFYTPNGEWDIGWTSVTNITKYGPNIPGLDFNVHLNRRSTYLTISITIPIFLLCFLNPFVFLLPATSGERMSFIVTIFLSLAVYMPLVGKNIPKVSDRMAGISYFLLVAMLYSCLLIILTIFTLRCEAINDLKKFPKWLLRLVSWTKCSSSTGGNSNRIQDNCDAKLDIDKTNDIVQKGPVISADKDDVMNFIDKIMFFTSLLIVTVIVSVFVGKYW
ncbi:Neuronal acetylcholine receptor subunit alpha-7 [Mizuhopecten yessoensis]|uniref:Neuronal acetylcholine receptor subunit alpha-7 n=1 Tax=Mizuhopecten yessoensis TaxID=6573 RepID=A0A210QNV9_MIZYE|nr:Neuronal acetylcholine receptor subunit alpha-7 [Mizuhopecten yessoensis]